MIIAHDELSLCNIITTTVFPNVAVVLRPSIQQKSCIPSKYVFLERDNLSGKGTIRTPL